jgi:hypothetical protein
MVPYTKGRIQVEGVLERSADENIRTSDKESDKRMKEMTQYLFYLSLALREILLEMRWMGSLIRKGDKASAR